MRTAESYLEFVDRQFQSLQEQEQYIQQTPSREQHEAEVRALRMKLRNLKGQLTKEENFRSLIVNNGADTTWVDIGIGRLEGEIGELESHPLLKRLGRGL